MAQIIAQWLDTVSHTWKFNSTWVLLEYNFCDKECEKTEK